MAATGRSEKSALAGALRTGTAVCALLFALAAPVTAQSVAGVEVPQDARMLLTADELIYNNRNETVVATGGVQIEYGGYDLVAERVEYDQRSGRMRAIGNVEMREPDGNIIYADNLDITDNFADGFVNELQILTPDRTRIAAESAERRGGVETQFNQGVYTACEPCKKNPEKAPFWQIKARRVIQDERTKTVKLEGARFELFGLPIAYLPYLEIPDYDRERKTGFLTPSFGSDDKLGAWLRVPYFITLGPSADATIYAQGYTQQGFLLEGEFRKRFDNGMITLRAAGIQQTGPDEFEVDTVDYRETRRGLIGSTGQFRINPMWSFGWDVMVESDPQFARTYGIEGFSDTKQISQAYLTGLGKRSYFDLRAFKVDVRDKRLRADGTEVADMLEDRQARVHPVLDYNKVFTQPVAGGELALDVNGQAISREDEYAPRGTYKGLEGENQRLTAEAVWRRTFTTPEGLRLTPILAARGDLHGFDTDSTPGALYNMSSESSASRGMVTAGLEASYPILATAGSSTHVFEPIAQVFVRPDERLAGGFPNEDAQTFVFDATSLFERDKFSGYDRIEGGSRANVGLRYTGTFANGTTTHAILGQSYHLGGLNSFAVTDLAYTGSNSGLDTDVSDFVALGSVQFPVGLSLSASGRFDKDDLDLKRGDVTAALRQQNLTTSITYTEIDAQKEDGSPGYGASEVRRGISGNVNLRFADNWRVFGSSAYDLQEDDFSTTTVGVAFENECVILTVAYTRLPDGTSESKKWSVGARLSLRTLGDLDFGNATGKTF